MILHEKVLLWWETLQQTSHCSLLLDIKFEPIFGYHIAIPAILKIRTEDFKEWKMQKELDDITKRFYFDNRHFNMPVFALPKLIPFFFFGEPDLPIISKMWPSTSTEKLFLGFP